jgi:hypothetical protein
MKSFLSCALSALLISTAVADSVPDRPPDFRVVNGRHVVEIWRGPDGKVIARRERGSAPSSPSLHPLASPLPPALVRRQSLAAAAAQAGVIDFPARCRVRNRPASNGAGCCAYACLEMLGHFHGYKQLDGLTENLASKNLGGEATVFDLVTLARGLGVPARAATNRDYEQLYAAIAAKNPPAVMVRLPAGGHAMVLLSIDPKNVFLVDPNKPKDNLSWPRWDFDRAWSGNWLLVTK